MRRKSHRKCYILIYRTKTDIMSAHQRQWFGISAWRMNHVPSPGPCSARRSNTAHSSHAAQLYKFIPTLTTTESQPCKSRKTCRRLGPLITAPIVDPYGGTVHRRLEEYRTTDGHMKSRIVSAVGGCYCSSALHPVTCRVEGGAIANRSKLPPPITAQQAYVLSPPGAGC